jgi:hypothetical protein
MKKTVLIFSMLAINISAFAQEMTCLEKLLPFNRYTGLHLVTKDEWTDGKENFDADSMKSALSYLVNSKLFCKSSEVVIKVFPVCTQHVADLPQSLTCFAYTNLGYFVASRDNARNVSFIFSKDRRFSEPTN